MIRYPSYVKKTLLIGISRGVRPPTMRAISQGSWLERLKALTGWTEKKSDASVLEQIDGNLYLQHMKQASKLGSLAGFARGQMAQATAQSLERQVEILEGMTSEERQQLHDLDPTVKERLIRNEKCTSGELEEVLRKFRATREVFATISRLKKEGRPIPTSMEELGQMARLDLSNDIHQGGKMKISRNAPCPCGSGKKYKRCCGK